MHGCVVSSLLKAMLLLACSSAVAQHTSGVSLLDGLIETITDVREQFFSEDIDEMQDFLAKPDVEAALDIYANGGNGFASIIHGTETNGERTLQSMSLESGHGLYDDDATFAFQTYGLAGGDAENATNYLTYADNFVRSSGVLSAEAVLVLNVHMYAIHFLHRSASNCQKGATETSDSLSDRRGYAVRELDSFIALYVGNGRSNRSEKADPNSLYQLAASGESLFDVTSPEGSVNERVRHLYYTGQVNLKHAYSCTKDSIAASELHEVTLKMISQLYVPLVQQLIHAMRWNQKARVKLYALAIVPQLSACKTSSYLYLKQHLLDQQYDQRNFNFILKTLRLMYPCLGITCDDVGMYRFSDEDEEACQDSPEKNYMAGYLPTGETRKINQLDLDIHQIRILVELDRMHSAELIYNFGKNARQDGEGGEKLIALKDLATSPVREVSPFYKIFAEYFNDPNYGDTMVSDVFSGNSEWVTPYQRAKYVQIVLSCMVMVMMALAEMKVSWLKCLGTNDPKNEEAHNHWDKAASFLIGSMEGSLEGGAPSDDGKLFYNLAKRRADEFPLSDPRFSSLGNRLVGLLFRGKGSLLDNDCERLDDIIQRLSHHIIYVPLLQSVVSCAIAHRKSSSTSPDAINRAASEAYVRSVLPLVANYNTWTANSVQENLFTESEEKVEEGPQAIADFFFKLMHEFGINCIVFGESDVIDACKMHRSQERPHNHRMLLRK